MPNNRNHNLNIDLNTLTHPFLELKQTRLAQSKLNFKIIHSKQNSNMEKVATSGEDMGMRGLRTREEIHLRKQKTSLRIRLSREETSTSMLLTPYQLIDIKFIYPNYQNPNEDKSEYFFHQLLSLSFSYVCCFLKVYFDKF